MQRQAIMIIIIIIIVITFFYAYCIYNTSISNSTVNS